MGIGLKLHLKIRGNDVYFWQNLHFFIKISSIQKEWSWIYHVDCYSKEILKASPVIPTPPTTTTTCTSELGKMDKRLLKCSVQINSKFYVKIILLTQFLKCLNTIFMACTSDTVFQWEPLTEKL